MIHSVNALNLVKSFEGCDLVAYPDGNGVWTIGYGHTGPDVHPHLICTQAQADAWLNLDLSRADIGIAELVKVPLNQNQYDAMVDMVFNIGRGHEATSTTLRELNQGNYEAACRAMGMWDIVAGKPCAGLDRRRAAEEALFRKAA